jgi:outer membrane immunogenic protein
MRRVAFAALLAVLSTAAFAADAPVARKAPPAPQQAVIDWAGPYFGIQFGAAFAHWEAGGIAINGYPIGISAGDFHAAGAIAGVHLGYQWHLTPNVVVGVEADIQKARVDNTRTILAIIDVRSSLEHYATLRAKAGVVHGPFMLYITGGGAWAKTETDVSILGLINASSDVSRTGWTVGAGVDMQITPSWIVGLQYKHLKFGDKTQSFSFGPIVATVPSNLTVDEVTFRASYRF